jgi:hypothetical protein
VKVSFGEERRLGGFGSDVTNEGEVQFISNFTGSVKAVLKVFSGSLEVSKLL